MTSVSRFSLALAIAACSSHSAATVDAPNATPLTGSVGCGSASCGSGQLCYAQYPGIDAGVQYYCETVPGGCTVFDCSGSACPACVLDQCGAYPDLVGLDSVMGRTVGCGGV